MSKDCPTCGSGCGIRYNETGAVTCETCRGTGRVESAAVDAPPLRMEGVRMAEIKTTDRQRVRARCRVLMASLHAIRAVLDELEAETRALLASLEEGDDY